MQMLSPAFPVGSYAYAASAERVTEMREQGAAFGQVIASITGQVPPALPYALALADATRAWLDANPEPAALRRLVVENLAGVERSLKVQARDAD